VGTISEQRIGTKKLFEKHELDKLLPPLESIFKALNWDFEGTDLTSFEDFARVIKTIQDVDPKSYVFRYPVTSKGDAYFSNPFIMNVISFAHRMDVILDYLGVLANGIPEKLRQDAEAKYELDEYFEDQGDR